jgi:hypothetical protein
VLEEVVAALGWLVVDGKASFEMPHASAARAPIVDYGIDWMHMWLFVG